MKRPYLIGLIVITVLILMLLVSIIGQFMQPSASRVGDVSPADQTATSEYLLNGGYPAGHPTSLPDDVINARLTQTAAAP